MTTGPMSKQVLERNLVPEGVGQGEAGRCLANFECVVEHTGRTNMVHVAGDNAELLSKAGLGPCLVRLAASSL